MFCPQCGAPNDDESIFCGNCGAVLNSDAEPAEAVEELAEEILAIEQEAESVEKMVDVAPDEQAVPETTSSPYAAPAPSPPTSGMAIAALVLGIGGLTIVPFLGSIVALILGYMARNEIRQRPDEMAGEGLAVAGIITGWIGVGMTVLGIVAVGGIFLCSFCSAFGASTGY